MRACVSPDSPAPSRGITIRSGLQGKRQTFPKEEEEKTRADTQAGK